ncbi:type VII secretion protein EssB [Enterococcus sp. BWB1-3]|uniref:type VII secretion protein EssB n=1 Tax=Enterococcus sp. BWB1-3 TaxID=2787713 RepID=UPI0019218D84|nr:type VII secretion protein EssB [Enterococcus sp. BWB1-3]MBL1230569.1 type VII secretion protein EssB [Enterococcus sp. BWB1-3]
MKEMTKKYMITFENHSFRFAKTKSKWLLSIQKSDVRIQSRQKLTLLEISHPLLLPMNCHQKEEAVIEVYTLPYEYLSFEDLKKHSHEDKLRAMVNTASIEELLDLPLTFFLHPDNLLFNHNLIPSLAYRGLREKMPPFIINKKKLLRQYKCLILELFEKNQNFSTLYEGQLEIKNGNSFIQTIIQLESIEEIRAYLMDTYLQTTAYSERTMCKVSKVKFMWMKRMALCMSILSVVMLGPLIYGSFFYIPFLYRMQEADTAFLKGNYEEVITTLKNEQIEKMPFTQKYELAYSFIQGEILQEKQRAVILNNITLRSEEDYLNYWIENGRGNYDEALDIAKKLEDSDLILFSIIQKMEQVRNDGSLKGTEKEVFMMELEEDYVRYQEKRSKMMDEAVESFSEEVEK